MKKILLTLMAACAAFSFASAQETGFGFGVKAGVNISEPDAGRRSQVQSGFHRRRIRRLPYLQLVRPYRPTYSIRVKAARSRTPTSSCVRIT